MRRIPRKTLGLICLLTTSVIWVISSFISSYLVKEDGANKSAKISPLLLTYLATSLFSVYLPLIALRVWYQRVAKPFLDKRVFRRGGYTALRTDEPEHGAVAGGGGSTGVGSSSLDAPDRQSPLAANGGLLQGLETALVDAPTVRAALWCFPFWFAAQWGFNASLSRTSVTSNTILSSTASLFTYGLSVVLLKETYTLVKLVCILACILGTALITVSDEQSSADGDRSVAGDLLCVLSAALYGLYTVLMRRQLPEDEHARVALFFGYVGLFTSLLLAPFVGVLLLGGWQSLAGVPRAIFLIILLEGLLDYVLSDYLWAHSVLLLGPTLATLGLSTQIPLAAVADLFLGQPTWVQHVGTVTLTLLGTALILAGFFKVNSSGGGDGDSGGGGGGDGGPKKVTPNSSSSGDALVDLSGAVGSLSDHQHHHGSHHSAGRV